MSAAHPLTKAGGSCQTWQTQNHDHDVTYYSYESGHQECPAHILRYLKDSIQNEPERTWNIQMRSLIQEMIHYRNGLDSSEECSPEKIAEFEGRYRAILRKAEEEYEYIPADDYYKEGYNLYLRMEQYMENHLLFLYDNRILYAKPTREQ